MSFPLVLTLSVQLRDLLLMMHVWGIFVFFVFFVFLFEYLSLPLSFSLTGHVSSCCQTSRGGRSPNVNVWMMTGTIISGDLKPSEGSTLENCAHFKFCSELCIESWSLDRLRCPFGTAGLKVVIK